MKKLKLDSTAFLKDYWQKKPGIFRNAFAQVEDILDEHELAGLAQNQEFEEEELDSRIISVRDGTWHHDSGPFEDFAPYCQGQWSLLVQGIENQVAEAQELLDAFDFIPKWRVDDLMMSFSVPGAGIGPHLDQYDVFIIQGKGSRRWQVGLPGEFEKVLPHPCIQQIKDFNAVIDEVLMAGDMIYIPPGHPHNGEAIENCINYSVGFRAATQTELLSHFCDHLIDHNAGNNRFCDPGLVIRKDASELKQHELKKFRQLLHSAIESEDFKAWLGKRLTEAEKFIPEPPETPYSPEEIMQFVNKGESFYKSPGLRYVHYEIVENSAEIRFFVNGNAYFCSLDEQEMVINLLNQPIWHNKSKNSFKNCSQFIHNLSTLVNDGLWTV